jgi:hypothetical protein
MKKCTICGKLLTDKALDLHHILNHEEKKKLKKLRRKQEVCAECKLTLLLLEVL